LIRSRRKGRRVGGRGAIASWICCLRGWEEEKDMVYGGFMAVVRGFVGV